MLHPVGPLPATVYWRRRAAAIVATVVVLVLVVWLLVSLTGGSAPDQAAQQSALGTSTLAASTTTVPPTTTAASTTEAPAASPAPTTAPAPAPTTTPAAAPAPAAAAPAPAVPPACPDTAIGLTAQVASPSYPVGQEPVFRILITNTSATACTRDLGAALQQVLVYSADGATRLWSSNDCFPGTSVDAPTINPGEVKTYSVKWAGTTSEPTCQAERTPVPAGSYRAVVSLGALTSQPVPFTLT